MTPSAPPPAGRGRAAVPLLAAAVAFPMAAWLQPSGPSAAWGMLLPALVAIAAYRGAVRAAMPPAAGAGTTAQVAGRRAAAVSAGWALLGIAADVLWRFALDVAGAGGGPLVDAVTLVVGAVVALARAAGRWLATRMDEAASATGAAGEVAAPLGVALVGGGCLALAAAGFAHLDAAAPRWQAAAVAASTALYAAVAVGQLQRLRREGLHEAWRRTGRSTQPAVGMNWTAGVSLLVGGAAAVVSLWWLPAVEPLRRAAEATPRSLIAWLRALMDPQTGDDRGEFLEWAEPDPVLAAGGDVSQTLVLVTAAVIVLVAVGAFLATARRRGRALGDVPLVTGLRRWAALLGALLAAVTRRRGRSRGATPRRRGRKREAPGPARVRAWRRPADPREQVRYDYLRVLDMAGRQGLGRAPSQSPLEYADVLRAGVPDDADVVDDLTRSFLRARYSHHPVPPEVAAVTRVASRRLRASLRARSG